MQLLFISVKECREFDEALFALPVGPSAPWFPSHPSLPRVPALQLFVTAGALMSNLLLESTNASLRLNVVNFFTPRNLMLPCVIQVYCFTKLYWHHTRCSSVSLIQLGWAVVSVGFLQFCQQCFFSLFRIIFCVLYFVVIVVVILQQNQKTKIASQIVISLSL